MEEVLLVTSAKETEGVGVFDIRTGSSVCTNFKNCGCDSDVICSVGGPSSFAGQGYSGDYVVVSQSKKPQINVWQWGKPQIHMQCHVQEITTAVAADPTGTYLIGGTKSGRLYWWDVCSGDLLASFQGHFKSVTAAQFTRCGLYLVTASLDGMVRMWDVIDIVSAGAGLEEGRNRGPTNVSPYRSWSPHTLPITGLHLQGSGSTGSAPLRVLTCSLDRTLVLYDVSASQQCLRRTLPEAAESVTASPLGDVVCVGGTSGVIYVLNLMASTQALSAVHKTSDAALGIDILEGHTRRVSTLAFSVDNCTLVSGSDDGMVRVWNTWARQCVREIKPLNKCAITSIMLMLKPPALQHGDQKLSFAPFSHLKKYKLNEGATATAAEATAASRRPDQVPMTTRFVGISNLPVSPPSLDSDVNPTSLLKGAAQVETQSKKRSSEGMSESFVQLPAAAAEDDQAVNSTTDTGFISANTGSHHGKKGKKARR